MAARAGQLPSRATQAASAHTLLSRPPLPPSPAPVQDAKLKYEDIDEVILVGGSTRIPAVQVRWGCVLWGCVNFCGLVVDECS